MNAPAGGTKKQVQKSIAFGTIILLAFLAFDAIYLKDTIIFIPAGAGAVLLYVASLVRIAVAGNLSGPLHRSLQVLAGTAFCAALFANPAMPLTARAVAPSIFLIGTIWVLYVLSRAYSELAGMTARALLIAAGGYLYYSLFAASGVPMLSQLAMIALIGFSAAGIFSFVGIVSGHSNDGIAAIGKAFTGLWGPSMAGTVVAIVMTYLVFVRPSLLGFGPMAVTVMEWAILCAAVYLVFRKIRSGLTASSVSEFGDGHRVAGLLHFDRGELATAAEQIEEFVSTGRKEGLITLAATALIRNDVPPATVRNVIAVVANYKEETEPPAVFRWAVGNMDEVRRRKRIKALDEMVAAAVAVMNNVHGRESRYAK